jgi:hypothetical protein
MTPGTVFYVRQHCMEGQTTFDSGMAVLFFPEEIPEVVVVCGLGLIMHIPLPSPN